MKLRRGTTPVLCSRALAAAAVLLVAALTSCSQQEATVVPVVSVEASKVERGPIEKVAEAGGLLYPLEQAAITAKVVAPVAKFYVNRGSRVRKHQLLAKLENRDLRATVTESKGAYEKAQAGYATEVRSSLPQEAEKARLNALGTRQAMEAQEKLYRSRKNLYAQGALPRKELELSAVALTQARNHYRIAEQTWSTLQKVGRQQQLKAASGQLSAAEGNYAGAQARLGYTEIRSPIDGVVTDRPFYAGETPSAGTPMLTIMNVSRVIARVHIPQEQAARLKPGDPATIDAPGVGEVAARVSLVSPAVDPNSTTIEVWVEAANPKGDLRPGTSVQVRMIEATVPDALVIPSSALMRGPGGASVMVVGSDGRAHQRAVKVGIQQGDRVQIPTGLREGELVVTSGAYGLPDNTRVRLSTAAASPPAPSARDQARP